MEKHLAHKQPKDIILQDPRELGICVDIDNSVTNDDVIDFPEVTISSENPFGPLPVGHLEWAETVGIIGNMNDKQFKTYLDGRVVTIIIRGFSMMQEQPNIGDHRVSFWLNGNIIASEPIPETSLIEQKVQKKHVL